MTRRRLTRSRAALAAAVLTPLFVTVAGSGPAQAATTTDLTITPNLVAPFGGNVTEVIGDAAPGFDDGSVAAAAPGPGGKSELYFDASALFGRDVTLGEVTSLSYWTKKGTDHVTEPRDWALVIYTKPYVGDASTPTWYGDRIGAEPYYSPNLVDPVDTWNQWSLDGAENSLIFYESTQGAPGANFGAYTDPDYATFVGGNGLSGDPLSDNPVLYFSIQTGSATAFGFDGKLDGLSIGLDDGSTATVNFEENAPDCTLDCYVDAATGNDLNGGASPADAKKTIQAGVDAVDPSPLGDAQGTVHIAEGTYAESVVVDKNYVTLLGAGTSLTVLQGSGTGSGISLVNSASGVRISHLTAQGYQKGIDLTGSNFTDVEISDAQTVDNTAHGIVVGGSNPTNLRVLRVNSSNNGIPGSAGRGLWVIDGVKTGITVQDSTFMDNNLVGIDINDGNATDVTITGNVVTGNGDSGIGVLGAQGPGATLVEDNLLENNGRFGIEIKIPTGNGATSGPGSVVVRDNTVRRTEPATDLRDHAGIAVFRRSGNPLLNADQPSGVVVSGNTVEGYQRAPADSTGDGFGILVEGTGHTVDHNTLFGNDVGVQIQAGNTANVQGTPYFDRGDASVAGAVITRNSLAGNAIRLRNVGAPLTDATCNWWGSLSGSGGVTGARTAPFLKSADLDSACVPTATVTSTGTVTEGGTPVFNVTLSFRPTAQVTVRYTTVNGTATTATSAIGGADYFARSGGLVFTPGGPLTQTVGVPTRQDTTDEVDEAFAFTLTTATNGLIGVPNSSTMTIVDNDAPARVTIQDAAVVEGNPFTGSLTKPMNFTVRLNAKSAKPVTVTWTTRNGTGPTGAVGGPTTGDFVSATGTVTIPAGSLQATVTVTVRKDTTMENDEQFFVDLSAPVNATFADAVGRGVITNDDGSPAN